MRVVILYNQPVLPPEHPEFGSEEFVSAAVEDISELLSAAGFRVSPLGIGRNFGDLQSELAACRPDVVFNLFEGLADQPETEVAVTRLLEQMQVPFTGSPSRALRLALNKHLAKRRFRSAGLPTPWSCVTRKLPLRDAEFPWPVIVKPARRDASEGINQRSVVTAPAALAQRVAEVLEHYGRPVLIEQFLPGREFTVALIETPQLVPLPITEVQYAVSAASPWPILSYDAKWQPGSLDYAATDMQKAVPLPSEISGSLLSLATRAYQAVGCRDYARIDLRMTPAGEPMILEVNANPDMNPTACFAVALATAGLDRANVLARFVRQAAARSRLAHATL